MKYMYLYFWRLSNLYILQYFIVIVKMEMKLVSSAYHQLML